MTANRDDLDRRDALKLIAGGLGLTAVLVAFVARGAAARAISHDPPAWDPQAVPNELYLADPSLHNINGYKIEAAVLRDSQGRSQAEILDRLAREVYAPYSTFWRGYLGDEATFRKWAESSLLARSHPIHTRVAALVRLNLDSLFTAGAAWVSHNTGHRPHGTWYIVFGPGWTDMGGFADGSMLADFTKMEPERDALEFKFPHEFTHMASASAAARRDADSGTVLAGIISEGVASYATYVYAAGRLARAQSIGYTEPEWTWALAHERDLIAAAKFRPRARAIRGGTGHGHRADRLRRRRRAGDRACAQPAAGRGVRDQGRGRHRARKGDQDPGPGRTGRVPAPDGLLARPHGLRAHVRTGRAGPGVQRHALGVARPDLPCGDAQRQARRH